MDEDPQMEDNMGILDRYNSLVEMDGVTMVNNRQSIERKGIS
jgi:hypothetical protein